MTSLLVSLGESIYHWVKPVPVPAPKQPLYHSIYAGDAAIEATHSSFAAAATTKRTGAVGREVKESVCTRDFLRRAVAVAADDNGALIPPLATHMSMALILLRDLLLIRDDDADERHQHGRSHLSHCSAKVSSPTNNVAKASSSVAR